MRFVIAFIRPILCLRLWHSMTLIQRPFSRTARVSRYQNVSILGFIGAKDDGGGEWWQLELQDVQSSSQIVTTNKPTPKHFYRPDALRVAQPTVSQHRREKYHTPRTCSPKAQPRVIQVPILSLTTEGFWLPYGGGCQASHQPSDSSTPESLREDSWRKLRTADAGFVAHWMPFLLPTDNVTTKVMLWFIYHLIVIIAIINDLLTSQQPTTLSDIKCGLTAMKSP